MRAGIVQSSKYLLEQIITKREFFRKQNENREKMREADLQKKLIDMQKSTDEQLDEKVTGKIDTTVPRTVMAILSSELTSSAFKKNKKQKSSKHSSTSHIGDVEPSSNTSENSTHLKSNQPQMLMSNAPVNQKLTGQQLSVPMNSAETMVDANGQQFFMFRQ